MPARLKDIARDLGVSVVTVSKVLRNHADIGEETRDRVRKRMLELNDGSTWPRARWSRDAPSAWDWLCRIWFIPSSPWW